jgi:PAS domain-containing protein
MSDLPAFRTRGGRKPFDEASRLAALRAYNILDTGGEEAFDRIVELAAAMFDTPIALVSLVDEDRQWFKAKLGIEATETPRSWAFCDHAIREGDALVVANALEDARFADNPLVTGEPKIRFYAGAAIETLDGDRLGTVCVIDRKPRPSLDDKQLAGLLALARLARTELDRRAALMQARDNWQRYRDFASVAADWFWEMDAHLRFSWISEDVARFQGIENALGQTRWALHGASVDSDPAWAAHRADLEARRPFRNFEVDGHDRNGDVVRVSISGQPTFDTSGKFAGYRGIAQRVPVPN